MVAAVARKIDQIRDDRAHGATTLARWGMEALLLEIEESRVNRGEELRRDLRSVARAVALARPTMVPLANWAGRFVCEIEESGGEEESVDRLKDLARRRGLFLLKQLDQMAAKVAAGAAQLVRSGEVVMTGSYSSTVVEALVEARRQGQEFRVLVAESRWGGQSYGKLVSAKLAASGTPAEVFPDEAIEERMGQASLTLVGADTVEADGSLINGYPTLRLARAAEEKRVPFYSACDTMKFAVRRGTSGDSALALEPGFERVPAGLVSGYVTEVGLLRPDEVSRHSAALERYARTCDPRVV